MPKRRVVFKLLIGVVVAFTVLQCKFEMLLSPVAHSATTSYPQSPSPSEGQEDGDAPIVVASVVNVTLPVTVLNEDGNFVRGLKQTDFHVFENRQQQRVVSFQKQDGLTLNLTLAMDISTSVRNRLAFEKEAIKEFLERLLDNKRDRASLVTFNEKVDFRQQFTSDFDRISSIVDRVFQAQGQTAVYDAVHKICTEQMKAATSKRRVILFITDGADTASHKTLDQAIRIAQQTEVVIFAISTKGGGVFRVEGNPYHNVDDKDLKRLCKETGGDVFFPSDMGQLKAAFRLAEQSLRNQYYLVYEPENSTPNGFRQIEVQIAGRKNFKVLTRSGYLATPQ